MFEYMNQINQIRQQVSQSGFSGTAVIDAHPKTGIIRLKVSTTPPENMGPFITGFAQLLNAALAMANVTAKVHIAEDK